MAAHNRQARNYAQSVISSAHFLSKYESADEFHEYVESFYQNTHSRIALPLLHEKEIFGFALACDFLKESGYSEFIKPDTRVNEICTAAGITSAKDDYRVFKDVISYCDKNDLVPYEFDKLIWLVGSGRFYLNNLNVNTQKKEFIKKYIREM